MSSLFRSIRNVSILAPLLLGGCASYYSHYAIFPASNSSGESRQVRVSWQTAEYPGWWLMSDQATPLKVETQCSQRIWVLTDESQSDARGDCGEGIRACAEPDVDLTANGRAEGDTVCMAISPANEEARIASLGRQVELNVYCRPAEIERTTGDGDKENMDYIRASSVPYVIDVRKAPRGSLAGRLPELDDAVCD